MQKLVRKLTKFIVILLLITMCALFVNKKFDMKIFGAKVAHADTGCIVVDSMSYEVAVEDTIEIPLSIDEDYLLEHFDLTIDDDFAGGFSVSVPRDYRKVIKVDFDDIENILYVDGLSEGTGYVKVEFLGDDGAALEGCEAMIEINVVEADDTTTDPTSQYPFDVTPSVDYNEISYKEISINATEGDEIVLSTHINQLIDGYSIAAMPLSTLDDPMDTIVSIDPATPVTGETDVDFTITCQAPYSGNGTIVVGYYEMIDDGSGISKPHFTQYDNEDYKYIIHLNIEEATQDTTEKIYSTSISTGEVNYEVNVGENVVITAALLPENITERPNNLEWTVDDPSLLQMINRYYDSSTNSFGGVFQGIKPGVTMIEIKDPKSNITTEVEVEVLAPSISSISMDQTKSVQPDTDFTLTAILGPTGIDSSSLPNDLNWSVADDTIIAINEDVDVEIDGTSFTKTFTPLKSGTTTITATVPETDISATCEVTVLQPIQITGVSLETSKRNLKVGESVEFTVTPTINNPNNQGGLDDNPDIQIPVTWSMSGDGELVEDPSTTSNTMSKKYIAQTAGSVIVTASATLNGTTISSSATITIEDNQVQVETIALDKTYITATVGTDEALEVTWTPTPLDAEPEVILTATDDEVISYEVDEIDTEKCDIIVTPLKPGRVTLTVTVGDKSEDCEIVVLAPTIPIQSISLDKSNETVKVGDGILLTVSVSPETATELPDEFIWTISNDKMEQVMLGLDTGELAYSQAFNALEAGTSTITATVPGTDISASCVVTITEDTVDITAVTLDKTTANIEVGDTLTLVASIAPEDATNKPDELTWESSNEDVVAIDADVQNSQTTDGKYVATFEALTEGTATITVTVPGTDITATCEVTVANDTIEITNVTLDKTTVDLKVGDVLTLTANIAPEDATNKPDNLTWESSNEDVVAIDADVQNSQTTDGKYVATFEALTEGTATITVTVPGTDITATCEVTVANDTIEITNVTLDKTTVDLKVGDVLTLTANIAPEDATNKPDNLTWESSNEDVVAIDADEQNSQTNDGKYVATFEALEEGTATITVTVPGTDITATCEVNVTEEVADTEMESFTIDKSYMQLTAGDSAQTVELTWTPNPLTEIPDIEFALSEEEVISYRVESIDKEKCTVSIRPLKAGRVFLTARAENYTTYCEVVVLAPSIAVESIALDKSTATIKVGEGVQLTASISPENATELPEHFNWTISNDKMQQILIGQDSEELEYSASFKALSEGTTTITVKIPNTQLTASCTVTILPADDPSDTSDTGDTSDTSTTSDTTDTTTTSDTTDTSTTSDTTDTSSTADTTDTTTPTEGLEVDVNTYEETDIENASYIIANNVNTLNQILSNIETNGEIKVYVGGELVTNNSAELPTGAIIEIKKGNETKTFQLVVVGDINGDAEIDDKDLLMLARYAVDLEKEVNFVKGPYLLAANVEKDNTKGDDKDILKLARILVGLE